MINMLRMHEESKQPNQAVTLEKGLKKLIWAGIPGSHCNLNCSYCYTGIDKGKEARLLYSVEHMLECFEPKRFQGPVFFGAASSGESLLWPEIIHFTKGMLLHGHVVSYTTNMTITPVIKAFCDFSPDLRSRLELDASLHYLELKKRDLLNIYFENLRMLKSAGISFAIFLCISDNYIPYLQEISELCQKEVGILPIAGMTRSYGKNGAKTKMSYTRDIDNLVKETCDTRQWELQKIIYGKKRTEFCHAGEYSLNLSLESGNYTKCWGSNGILKNWQKSLVENNKKTFKGFSLVNKFINKVIAKDSYQIMGNIFKDPYKPIRFEPMGKCPFYDCVCASYLCWGLIPEIDIETHSKTFFTKDTVSEKIWDLMDIKICQQ